MTLSAEMTPRPVQRTLTDTPASPAVQGLCAPAFDAVFDAFAANFAAQRELGAALAIEVDGRAVMDVWGGFADAPRSQPWQRDTLCVVFSNTKPATALCAHRLAEAGALDLDAPVSRLWPAFGASDKRDITPRMLLDHTAGLPVLQQRLPEGAAFDWPTMVQALEQQAPLWQPGTRVGYHALTFGWLVGELVRRASGQSLGRFFQQEIAQPLGLDFWIGLPEDQEPRVAPIVPVAPATQARNDFERAVLTQPDSMAALYLRNSGGWRPLGFNTRAGHAAEMGASGGITDARSLARLYGTLATGGQRDGYTLLKPDTIQRAAEVSSATHLDATLLTPTRFGAGFMRATDHRARGLDSAAFGRHAFGHVGAGGSLAFADPTRRLGFAYVMNRQGPGTLLNERAHALVAACEAACEAAWPGGACQGRPD